MQVLAYTIIMLLFIALAARPTGSAKWMTVSSPEQTAWREIRTLCGRQSILLGERFEPFAPGGARSDSREN